MQWFDDMKIGKKLISSFILVALFAGVVGWVGVISIKRVEDAGTFMYEKKTLPISHMLTMNVDFHRMRVSILKMVYATDSEERQAYAKQVADLDTTMDKARDEYAKSIIDDEDRKLYQDFKTADEAYVPIREEVASLALAEQPDLADEILRGEGAKAARAVQASLEAMVAMNLKDAKETDDNNTAMAGKASLTMEVLALIGGILAVLLGVFVARSITVPLRQGVDFSAAVAGGDLTQAMALNRKDEVGELATSMNAMVVKLKGIIGNINGSVKTLSSSATEMSAISSQMTSGAETTVAKANAVAGAAE